MRIKILIAVVFMALIMGACTTAPWNDHVASVTHSFEVIEVTR